MLTQLVWETTSRTTALRNRAKAAVLELYLLRSSQETQCCELRALFTSRAGLTEMSSFTCDCCSKISSQGQKFALRIHCRSHNQNWPYPSEKQHCPALPSGWWPGRWRYSERRRRCCHPYDCYPTLGTGWSKILHFLWQGRPSRNGVQPREQRGN